MAEKDTKLLQLLTYLLFNQSHANGLILHPMKTLESQRFSGNRERDQWHELRSTKTIFVHVKEDGVAHMKLTIQNIFGLNKSNTLQK